MRRLWRLVLFICFSFLSGTLIALAGDLTPNASPAATGYTLEDIYTRLTTNDEGVSGDHNLQPAEEPGATFYSLDTIYGLIPTINPDRVFTGTNYLGIDGSLNLACNTDTFDGTDNLIGDDLDGDGDGSNRWCTDNSGNATATTIISGRSAWVDGVSISGTFDTSNLSNDVIQSGVSWGASGGQTGTLTPDGGTAGAAGLFSGLTAHLTDDWLLDTGTLDLACNTLTFNGTANLVANAYDGSGDGSNRWCIDDSADATASTLLDGSIAWVDGVSVTGTYDVSNLSNAVIQSGVSWGASGGQTGTLTPDGGTAGAAGLFSGLTAHLTDDWSLDTGTLNLACNTSTFNGTANLVANAYDGSGDGSNRWCMDDSGTATASSILSGSSAWVDGVSVSGSMTNVGTQTITPSTSNQTITEGYHDGAGYCAGDANLVASNIKNGVDLFGVSGTYSPTIDLPTCSFGGTTGDVWIKNSACSWSDRCQVGTNCSDGCLVTLITHTVASTTSYTSSCYVAATLIGEPCDICVVP